MEDPDAWNAEGSLGGRQNVRWICWYKDHGVDDRQRSRMLDQSDQCLDIGVRTTRRSDLTRGRGFGTVIANAYSARATVCGWRERARKDIQIAMRVHQCNNLEHCENDDMCALSCHAREQRHPPITNRSSAGGSYRIPGRTLCTTHPQPGMRMKRPAWYSTRK